MLWGGQGKSLKLKRRLIGGGPNETTEAPTIVDNSPGEKVSIVDEIIEEPHSSSARRLVK